MIISDTNLLLSISYCGIIYTPTTYLSHLHTLYVGKYFLRGIYNINYREMLGNFVRIMSQNYTQCLSNSLIIWEDIIRNEYTYDNIAGSICLL